MLETRSLADCLTNIRTAIADFERAPTYLAAEAICLETRDGWSAYLTQFLADESLCTDELRDEFDALLQTSASLLNDYEPEPDLDDTQLDRMPGFAKSARTRIELLALLHEKGRDAVKAELERRAKTS